MTEAHTPGPWRIDRKQPQTVLGPDSFMVADCAILSIRKKAPTEARCIANARLIAAAPDMLKALTLIASTGLDHAMVKIAYAATAKATKGE